MIRNDAGTNEISEQTAVRYVIGNQTQIKNVLQILKLIVYCFTSRSSIFQLYGDVTD
jgi:hypothetical protein